MNHRGARIHKIALVGGTWVRFEMGVASNWNTKCFFFFLRFGEDGCCRALLAKDVLARAQAEKLSSWQGESATEVRRSAQVWNRPSSFRVRRVPEGE